MHIYIVYMFNVWLFLWCCCFLVVLLYLWGYEACWIVFLWNNEVRIIMFLHYYINASITANDANRLFHSYFQKCCMEHWSRHYFATCIPFALVLLMYFLFHCQRFCRFKRADDRCNDGSTHVLSHLYIQQQQHFIYYGHLAADPAPGLWERAHGSGQVYGLNTFISDSCPVKQHQKNPQKLV